MQRVSILVVSCVASGCMIGTWRMHPGANMARVEEHCDIVSVNVAADTVTCRERGEVVDEPSPVAWNAGVITGRGLSTIGSGDSAALSIEAEAELSYVLPGDRFGVGVQVSYLRDLMNSPNGKSLDAVTGWGGSVLGHFAATKSIVLHGGLGAVEASYVLNQGDPNEADSNGALALRALAGVSVVIARSEHRDFFFMVQSSYLHVPDAMVGGRDLGYGNLTIAGALGLALAP